MNISNGRTDQFHFSVSSGGGRDMADLRVHFVSVRSATRPTSLLSNRIDSTRLDSKFRDVKYGVSNTGPALGGVVVAKVRPMASAVRDLLFSL